MNEKKKSFRKFIEGFKELRKKRPSDKEIEEINDIIEQSHIEDTEEGDSSPAFSVKGLARAKTR